jgi:1,4-alpha-glucan branching enzyme
MRRAFVILLAIGCGSHVKPDDPYRPRDFSVGGDAASAPNVDGGAAAPGVEFSVWAPEAQHVFVAGDWNGWSESADELAPDGAGHFGARIAAAQVGQSYQLVIVSGAATVKKPDPRARAVTSDGKSVIVDARTFTWSASFTPPPVAEQVIYELHIGTFNMGNTTGTTPSTFTDAIARLDHVASLGVNMLEILPPAAWPGPRSWGYNPSLPFAVEPVYGTPDDLRRFVDAAHARNMGVIVDVVHNHYTSRTPLVCFDGDCLGASGAWFYTDARRTTPWGPRPDFSRADVRRFIVENALLWLDEYRSDGLRWDSVSNIRQANGTDNPDGQQLLREAMDAVHTAAPHALQVAEDLQTIDSITQTTQAGGFGFDTQWDAAFFHPVDDTIITANDADRKMSAIAGALTHQYNSTFTERVVYTEDHDEVANGKARIPQMISPTDPASWDARKRSTLGAAIVMTAPGVPMIFMGQEFLEDGSFSDTNPLDWTKVQKFAPIVQLYRDLIRLRRNLDGHTAGLTGGKVDVFHVNETAHVIAYRRDDVIVLANFSAKAFTRYDLGLPAGGTWHVRFTSDAKIYSDDFGDGGGGDVTATAATRDNQPFTGSFVLPAYTAIIASR